MYVRPDYVFLFLLSSSSSSSALIFLFSLSFVYLSHPLTHRFLVSFVRSFVEFARLPVPPLAGYASFTSTLFRLLGPAEGARVGGVLLDVVQRGERRPQRGEEATVVAEVQVAQDGLDGLGGLVGLVEGDATEDGRTG